VQEGVTVAAEIKNVFRLSSGGHHFPKRKKLLTNGRANSNGDMTVTMEFPLPLILSISQL
jgi:hypothetical protein